MNNSVIVIFNLRRATFGPFLQLHAYSLIRTRWARFFCKHVRITKKIIFSYNKITAAYNAVHNKSVMVKINTL